MPSPTPKRSRTKLKSVWNLQEGVKIILLDIEGTTTPITFVADVLFPYIRENVQDYLRTHWKEEQCQADVDALRQQAKLDKDVDGVVTIPDPSEDKDGGQDGDEDSDEVIREEVVKSVLWLMDADRKVTGLKQLQGHMWEDAYASTLKGEVYDDVVPAIKRWIAEEKKVYIYSSGSVQAQKLLFGHSNQGNLLPLLSGHYDTKIGAKVEKESYTKIAADMKAEAESILFLTDVSREARPAKEAGLKSALVVRPGNKPLTEQEKAEFDIIKSFDDLWPEGEESKDS
ncbi:enolase-phosphatase E1-like [Diadema antillarum]|uniref:enolase-phosphatase E1-like n=1 Tax=Diadema antillarum TaxID=105358 RepID=UPI003A8ADB5E